MNAPIPGRLRYELKFLLPCSAKKRLSDEIRFALRPDTHGNDQGCYRISSLYYDTRHLETYWDKLDGVLQRQKFRLRYYGRPQEEPEASFFEIKHRYNNCVSKERLRLTPEKAASLLRGESGLDELAEDHPRNQADKAMLTRLLHFHQLRPLHPVLIVSYLREALVGIHEPDLRVTFDHYLSAHGARDYLSPGFSDEPAFLGPEQFILEVKFDQNLPRWLQQRLVSEQLRPIRFSKYAEAVTCRTPGLEPLP